jgi:hypothetical protein
MSIPTSTPASVLAKQCACGHNVASHDEIASRYCAATTSGRLVRGCICKPA